MNNFVRESHGSTESRPAGFGCGFAALRNIQTDRPPYHFQIHFRAKMRLASSNVSFEPMSYQRPGTDQV